ncbi:MAG: BPL-N domain-containing protein [Planctomycetota bacterium]|nr:BPL-N domain-containing protein [Planctomycetota bacterium]
MHPTARPLVRLLALIGMLASGGVAQSEPEAAVTTRLRLVPSRVVVTTTGKEVASLAKAESTLRAFLQARGLAASGPLERVFIGKPGSRKRGKAAYVHERARIEIDYAKRALPEGTDAVQVVRLPAQLVYERSAPATRAAYQSGAEQAPPLEGIASRGLVWTGAHDQLFYAAPADAAQGTLYEWWTVVPRGRADIGLYTGLGAHPNAVKTAAAACLHAGLTIRPLTPGQVNDGSFRKQVRCLLVPGGWAGDYVIDVDAKGAKHVRSFIDGGGGYVGVCAGAFFAASRIRWEGIEYDYPLDLFEGPAIGPIEKVAPWPQHALAALKLDASHAMAKGLGTQRQAFYLGGPWFELKAPKGSSVEVVARYAEGGAPAIVTFRRKRGRVFLSGVHIEYDLTSAKDDISWPESEGRLKDPESDWDLFQRGVRWAVGDAQK